MKALMVCLFLFMGVTAAQAKSYSFIVCPWPGMELYYVAQDKGFYEKEGILFDFREFTTLPDWYRATVSGRYDFGPLWSANVFGFHVSRSFTHHVIIGNFFHEEGLSAFVTEKGVTGKKLKGKVIGLDADIPAWRYMFHQYLSGHDMSLSDVRFVVLPTEDLLANFVRRRLTVISAIGEVVDKAVKTGDGEILISTTDYPLATLSGITVSRSTWKTMPKEDIRRFIRGTIQAVVWMKAPENEEELRKIVLSHFSNSPGIREAYNAQVPLKKYRAGFKIYDVEEMKRYNTVLLRELFDGIVSLYQQSGPTDIPDYDTIVDISAMKDVLKEYHAW